MFVLLGRQLDSEFWREPWFAIGVAMAVSTVFVEPYFSRPQDGIVNGCAAALAFLAVDRDPVSGLWFAYLAFVLGVACLSAIATMSEEGGVLKWLAYRTSVLSGRAVILGTAALLLETLTRAARGDEDFEYLAAGTAVLAAALAVPWGDLLPLVIQGKLETGLAFAAIGPRMILARTPQGAFREGQPVSIARGGKSVNGVVVARLPHREGLRYQVALESDWTDLCANFPATVAFSERQDETSIVGAVGQRSSDTAIEFELLRRVQTGMPVTLQVNGRQLLYQISKLRLAKADWAGSSAVLSQATARQVGWPEAGRLRSEPYLPQPHQLVYRPDEVAMALPDGHYRLGLAKGTRIDIGIALDGPGHIAVLGMSGMGKTAIAQRICGRLGQDMPVIALDTTGEYRGVLAVPAWAPGDFDTPGFFAYEPAGDPPQQAAAFIQQVMTVASDEYRDPNREVAPRTVLLEEAHSYLPEYGLAIRNQQESVAYSTRMIMQARKFALRFVIVSQRSAVVSKSALSQCENYIVLRMIDETSLNYLEAVVGADTRDAITSLRRYEAVCVGPAFNTEAPVIVSLDAP